MGRVQDAMRRAASGEAEAATGAAPGTAALAAEAFPDEALAESPAAESTVGDATAAEALEAEPAGEVVDPIGHLGPGLVSKIVVDDRMMPASREQYRRLAAALHHAQEASGLKVVMIASAVAGEGKSLTAANLALTLSESYRRSVLLVDGDLRRPSLDQIFGVETDTGLSEALDSPDEPRLTLYELSPKLTLLPAGRPNTDPMAGLTSVRMRALIDEARGRFDWVIIDTPPVGLLTDASLLAAMVDGTLLVIRADATPYQLVQRAVESIGSDGLLGAVLNRAGEITSHSAYSYYAYYSSPRSAAGGG